MTEPATQLTHQLSGHGIAMMLFAGAVFALLIWDRLSVETVCLGILAGLPLSFALFPMQTATGAIDPLRFFAGFAHPALVAICGLMIVGHGLVVTGALEPAARKLAGWLAASPRLALLGVLLGATAVSGVVNDTPVVVLLIPLILAAARRARAPAATMLLPMNYAVLIGGMSTTIGTSTNLIVVALAAGLGVGPIGIFSFFPIVAVAAVPAVAYLWLVAPRLLKNVQTPTEELSAEVFDAEMRVEPGAWLEGRQLREVFGAGGDIGRRVKVRRGSHLVSSLPSMVLRAGDRLMVQDTAAGLKEIEARLHATLHNVKLERQDPLESGTGRPLPEDDEPVEPAIVAQMIITPASPLVGRSIKQERLAERFGVVVVGMRPSNVREGWNRGDLADRQIGAGDILLLQGPVSTMQAAQREDIGLLLDARYTLPRQDKAWAALLVMGAVVLLAATKTLPISLAALSGVLFLLATRCLSWQDVAQSLSVKVVLLVAASLALGDALDVSGATAWQAQRLAEVSQGLSPAWVLALLMGLMGVLTNFVSNSAAAAIGTPLGVELARSLGVPPEAFVLAVLFGCNLCYATPMGYQTNLLVMNAGGYRFADFTRVGLPLFVIMWAGLCYGLVLRYQL